MPLFIVFFTFTLDLLKYAIVTRSFDLIFASVTLQRLFESLFNFNNKRKRKEKELWQRFINYQKTIVVVVLATFHSLFPSVALEALVGSVMVLATA